MRTEESVEMHNADDYNAIDTFCRSFSGSRDLSSLVTFLGKILYRGVEGKCRKEAKQQLFMMPSSLKGTVLQYFTANFLPRLSSSEDYTAASQLLRYKYPNGSVDEQMVEKLLQDISTLLEKNESVNCAQMCFIALVNSEFKPFYSKCLDKYCIALGKTIEIYAQLSVDENKELLDKSLRELRDFTQCADLRPAFLEHALPKLFTAFTQIAPGNINDLWTLTSTILFHQTLMNEQELNESIQLLHKDLEKFYSRALIEAFVVHFKSKPGTIAKFVMHHIDTNLNADADDFLSRVVDLFSSLNEQKVMGTVLKSFESSVFGDIAASVINSRSTIGSDDLESYYHAIETMIICDPTLLLRDVYGVVVDGILGENSRSKRFTALLLTIVNIFGRDIEQFVKSLTLALYAKMGSTPKSSKKRKREANENGTPVGKRGKMTNGSASTAIESDDESQNKFAMWPAEVKGKLDEIFAEINVGQTIRLWKLFNKHLSSLIEEVSKSMDANSVVFKISYIESLLCQMFSSSRVHEHLVQKGADIAQVLEEFNQIQHKFYNTIIKMEYNDRVMGAFLKISCDYENFLMLYFYHHDENMASDVRSAFMTDSSRIKSSEWKIIQQRINNFGKREEKRFSSLLMIQHHLRNGAYGDDEAETARSLSQSHLLDQEQFDLLMSYTGTRPFIRSMLDTSISFDIFVEYLYRHIDSDSEKFSFALETVEIGPSILQSFIDSLLTYFDNVDYDLEKLLKILNKVPLTNQPSDTKKTIFEKMLQNCGKMSYDLFMGIAENLVRQESYRGFFKDFSLKAITKKIKDAAKYERFYGTIFRNSFKRPTSDSVQCLESLVGEQDVTLLEICAKVVSEINMVSSNECPADTINQLKIKLIAKLLSHFNEENITERQEFFLTVSKLCRQNLAILDDNGRQLHLNLLNNLLLLKHAPSFEINLKLLTTTLKDAEKLKLSDELIQQGRKLLFKIVYKMIKKNLSEAESDKQISVEIEREMIALLAAANKGTRKLLTDFLIATIKKKGIVTIRQKIYIFSLCRVMFEVCDKPVENKIPDVNGYMELCAVLVSFHETNNAALLSAILNAHTAMLKWSNSNLNNISIECLITFYLSAHNRPAPSEQWEDFCGFNTTVGEFIFIIGKNHPKFVQSRTVPYLKTYLKFLYEIYLYKNEAAGNYEAREIWMLRRLTLQLQNIIDLLINNRSASLQDVSKYVLATLIDVFNQKPKLYLHDKTISQNLQNIGMRMLELSDKNDRNHLMAAAKELARDGFEEMFKRMK